MKKFKQLCAVSIREFATTRGLTLCGLMCALAIVLNLTARIDFGEYIRISFSGLANRVVECLFGPVIGCLFGGATDLLNFFVRPVGTFFPGYTFNKMLEGFLFGAILYQKPLRITRIFIAQLLVKLIVNCCLNSLWLYVLNGQAIIALMPIRLLKNAVMLPIDTLITFLLLAAVSQILRRLNYLPFCRERSSAQ